MRWKSPSAPRKCLFGLVSRSARGPSYRCGVTPSAADAPGVIEPATRSPRSAVAELRVRTTLSVRTNNMKNERKPNENHHHKIANWSPG